MEPTADEWVEARRLSKKFDTQAVIIGHSLHSGADQSGFTQGASMSLVEWNGSVLQTLASTRIASKT